PAPPPLHVALPISGQENAQPWNMPNPVGSALFLRAALFPASVYTPECSQLPHMVEPSSCSWAKPSSCCPAALTILPSLSFTSVTALPLISLSTSARSGLMGLV